MVTCYAALEDRLVVARGADGDWTTRERLRESAVECVAADRATPDRIFVGTADSGLERSTDGGDSWESTLHAGDRVTAVTVDPTDPDVVWAGTEPSAVYRSTDGGETWTEKPGLTDLPSAEHWSFPPRPDTHHVRWLAVAPDDPDRLYVAVEAGAFVVSPDGGETWIDRPEGSRYDNHTVATHPDAPSRVYSAAGDGYAESTDRGEHWRHPQDGLDHRYVWGLAVAPSDPDEVFVSAASGARAAHSPDGTSYVYRRRIPDDDTPTADATGADTSTDGEWHLAMEGLPGPEDMARPVLAAGEDAIYALTNEGLFVREGERSWDICSLHWPGVYTHQVPRGLAVV